MRHRFIAPRIPGTPSRRGERLERRCRLTSPATGEFRCGDLLARSHSACLPDRPSLKQSLGMAAVASKWFRLGKSSRVKSIFMIEPKSSRLAVSTSTKLGTEEWSGSLLQLHSRLRRDMVCGILDTDVCLPRRSATRTTSKTRPARPRTATVWSRRCTD